MRDMRILLTGAFGLIGRALSSRLLAGGHQLHLAGRAPRKGLPAGARFSIWDFQSPPPAEALEGTDAVIHLAGEPVAQRWTAEAKRKIRSSRVEGTRLLVEGLEKLAQRPRALVCASAVGYYGDRGEEELTEDSGPGKGFLAGVCLEWEAEARKAEILGIRVVLPRIGVVLSPDGGALAKMLPAFRAGAGGRLGSGKQWMAWIHIGDLVGLLEHAAASESVRGAINAVSPNPVRNSEFASQLGAVLRRPAILPVPEMAVRILFGEMSVILFASQKLIPKAALRAGFQFQFPELDPALRNLLAG